ncbi:hypothetical protein [uncultured Methanobrevibacter sp.]|uniref:hypothetical protein n=1 Tax=uncultured Methanobrevibacter sp. TaxID=253161 RepID=UPI0026000554|nr:hypothetical protein [uncultured Methanobrevibacter sp.]
MKKEVFVSIIQTLEDYKHKSTKFGETIAKAHIEAGYEKDFINSYAYEYPYGPLIDSIVDAIGKEFADDYYKAEQATDIINWWMWECNFGKETYIKFKNEEDGFKTDPYEVPMAEITLENGKKFIVKTPEKLYEVIMEDKKISKYNLSDKNG